MTRVTRSNKRTPVGQRNVLRAEEKKGFKRRFVNDKDNRIQMFLDAGYTIVQDGSSVADKNVGDSHGTGSVAGKYVGDGTRAILMEIPEEFYKEDLAAKSERIKATEAGLGRNEHGSITDEGIYGEGISTGRPKITIG